MVYDWGMSKKIGFLSLGDSSQVFIGRDYQTKNDFSEKLAGIADDEIMSILNSNYKRAKEVLTENIDILHEMAKLLLARETIYKEEVDMVMAGKKTEEIVKLMEEKEKKQKEKEARLKAQKDKVEKLANFKRKIAEGENLVKMGIITEAELDNLKKEYVEFEKSLNKILDEGDSSVDEENDNKAVTGKQVEKEMKKEEKTADKQGETKSSRTKKAVQVKPKEKQESAPKQQGRVENKSKKDTKNDEEN